MKSLVLALAALILIPSEPAWCQVPVHSAGIHSLSKRDEKLAWAFENHISEIRVTCSGTVVYKLADDLLDIRHQRFLIELESGQTLLIVHNIDLVKRVKPLRLGDKVTVRGEYIWNDKGGLIHYTHRDPAGLQPSGWIKHRGVLYW